MCRLTALAVGPFAGCIWGEHTQYRMGASFMIWVHPPHQQTYHQQTPPPPLHHIKKNDAPPPLRNSPPLPGPAATRVPLTPIPPTSCLTSPSPLPLPPHRTVLYPPVLIHLSLLCNESQRYTRPADLLRAPALPRTPPPPPPTTLNPPCPSLFPALATTPPLTRSTSSPSPPPTLPLPRGSFLLPHLPPSCPGTSLRPPHPTPKPSPTIPLLPTSPSTPDTPPPASPPSPPSPRSTALTSFALPFPLPRGSPPPRAPLPSRPPPPPPLTSSSPTLLLSPRHPLPLSPPPPPPFPPGPTAHSIPIRATPLSTLPHTSITPPIPLSPPPTSPSLSFPPSPLLPPPPPSPPPLPPLSPPVSPSSPSPTSRHNRSLSAHWAFGPVLKSGMALRSSARLFGRQKGACCPSHLGALLIRAAWIHGRPENIGFFVFRMTPGGG